MNGSLGCSRRVRARLPRALLQGPGSPAVPVGYQAENRPTGGYTGNSGKVSQAWRVFSCGRDLVNGSADRAEPEVCGKVGRLFLKERLLLRLTLAAEAPATPLGATPLTLLLAQLKAFEAGGDIRFDLGGRRPRRNAGEKWFVGLQSSQFSRAVQEGFRAGQGHSPVTDKVSNADEPTRDESEPNEDTRSSLTARPSSLDGRPSAIHCPAVPITNSVRMLFALLRCWT